MNHWIYCWESGGGSGHLTRMRAVSTALEARGERVTWCVLPQEAGQAARFWPRVSLAPVSARPVASVRSPGSMAEILQNEGWNQERRLKQWISQWQHRFSELGADRILLDYAPNALLAGVAQGRRVDVAGTGFYIPPCHTPLPAIRSDHGVYPDRLQWAETQIVATLNLVHSLDINSLSDVFHHAQVRNHLLTYPELDHYGVRDNACYSGVVSGFAGDNPDWPDDTERRVFAYLKPFPQLPHLLKLIDRMGARLRVHGGEVVGTLVRQASLANVEFCPRPVNEQGISQAGCVMINHAGHDGTVKAMQAGLALLQLPLNIEQSMTARNAAALGASEWLAADQVDVYGPALERLFAEQSTRAAAGRTWAESLSSPQQNMRCLLDDLDL